MHAEYVAHVCTASRAVLIHYRKGAWFSSHIHGTSFYLLTGDFTMHNSAAMKIASPCNLHAYNRKLGVHKNECEILTFSDDVVVKYLHMHGKVFLTVNKSEVV